MGPDPDIIERFEVRALFGARTGQPLVAVQIGDRKAFNVTPEKAREMAMLLLEGAEAALADGFLIAWMTRHGMSLEEVGLLIEDFRRYREEREQGG